MPTPIRSLRVPDAEWRAFKQAASTEGVTVGEWVRSTCRTAVKLPDPAGDEEAAPTRRTATVARSSRLCKAHGALVVRPGNRCGQAGCNG